MALRRSIHNLSALRTLPFSMNQISAASATTTTIRNPIGRDISSIPFSLTQKLKPDSTNLKTDRLISSIRQSDQFTRLQTSRGYTTRSSLPKIPLVFHISEGMGEILADYVHQEITRKFMVISLGLFEIIFIKDVLVFLLF